VDIGGNKSKTRDFHVDGVPGSLTGDLSLDVKGTVWTTAAEYRLATSDPAFTVDLLAGVRMFNMKNTLGWNFTGAAGSHPLAGRSGSTVVERDPLGRHRRRQGQLHLRRRAPMVRPLLLRHRHRPVGPDLPDRRRHRLPVQVG
jgi:hypothetical protein